MTVEVDAGTLKLHGALGTVPRVSMVKWHGLVQRQHN